MIFVALLYSQFPIKGTIHLDTSKSIVPLGWASLRDWGHGVMGAAGFKFAYIETDVPKKTHPLSNIGFTDTSIKPFLEFFSFITKDGHIISEFEERVEGTRYFETMTEVQNFLATELVNGVREGMPFIEANFAIRYWPQPPLGYIAITDAWRNFLGKEEKYRDMVSVFCARFGGPHNGIYQIFNKETLQIFLLVTVLEGLLKPRQKCAGDCACSTCGPLKLKHNVLRTEVYWRDELEKTLRFSDNSEYIDLIISLRESVRDSFAHAASLLPDAALVIDPIAQGPHTRFLQLPDVIGGLNTDHLARVNALMILRDVVWFVLMDKFFPNAMNDPWPNTGLIKEFRTG